MIGTIIFVVAIALSLDTYFKEKREEEDKEYAQLISRKRAIDEFVIEIGMDRRRAEQLYNSGYRSITDFQGMSLEELMEMDNINPTLAKRIATKAEKIGS
jgi:ERCC4-type nuclease